MFVLLEFVLVLGPTSGLVLVEVVWICLTSGQRKLGFPHCQSSVLSKVFEEHLVLGVELIVNLILYCLWHSCSSCEAKFEAWVLYVASKARLVHRTPLVPGHCCPGSSREVLWRSSGTVLDHSFEPGLRSFRLKMTVNTKCQITHF